MTAQVTVCHAPLAWNWPPPHQPPVDLAGFAVSLAGTSLLISGGKSHSLILGVGGVGNNSKFFCFNNGK